MFVFIHVRQNAVWGYSHAADYVLQGSCVWMKRFSTVYHDRFAKKPPANYSGLSMRLLPVLYFRLYLNTSHDVYLSKYTINDIFRQEE